jgi:hypothetical protein
MLSINKIISIFCLIDNILQGIDFKEDIIGRVRDSEIILTAIVSSTSFYGNNYLVIKFIKVLRIYKQVDLIYVYIKQGVYFMNYFKL